MSSAALKDNLLHILSYNFEPLPGPGPLEVFLSFAIPFSSTRRLHARHAEAVHLIYQLSMQSELVEISSSQSSLQVCASFEVGDGVDVDISIVASAEHFPSFEPTFLLAVCPRDAHPNNPKPGILQGSDEFRLWLSQAFGMRGRLQLSVEIFQPWLSNPFALLPIELVSLCMSEAVVEDTENTSLAGGREMRSLETFYTLQRLRLVCSVFNELGIDLLCRLEGSGRTDIITNPMTLMQSYRENFSPWLKTRVLQERDVYGSKDVWKDIDGLLNHCIRLEEVFLVIAPPPDPKKRSKTLGKIFALGNIQSLHLWCDLHHHERWDTDDFMRVFRSSTKLQSVSFKGWDLLARPSFPAENPWPIPEIKLVQCKIGKDNLRWLEDVYKMDQKANTHLSELLPLFVQPSVEVIPPE
ncbi:hypothetical protein BT69DRAFT_1128171 [Atractiella rhizophila]|nr:hypothetical protein BT69DRAFT_1128171 [Atractiella rhizophila]